MLKRTEVTPLTIPGQRTPFHDALPPDKPRKRGTGGLWTLVIAVLLAVFVPAPDLPPGRIANAATPATAPTEFELAQQALDRQSDALVKGDKTGWLAAVSPALRKRYDGIFTSLRTLGVTAFAYDAEPVEAIDKQIVTSVAIDYCMGRTSCPEPARFTQQMTLEPGPDGYVITRLAIEDQGDVTPWENGDLVFAKGKRVTVAAPPALRKRLGEVVKSGDRAAKVADRFAKAMSNPQQKYRIFLAGDKEWKSWYGGEFPGYSVAYTIRLDESGSDVVLHMSEFDDKQQLDVTIQHEMAHVSTLSNLVAESGDGDLWLMEGVAEYAGWLPLRAGRDIVMPALRSEFRGSKRPKTIVQPAIHEAANQRSADVFYGLGNYAVACLVTKFGEAKALKFVRQKLRENKTLDEASRSAFGKPFSTVDKSCLSWIGSHLE